MLHYRLKITFLLNFILNFFLKMRFRFFGYSLPLLIDRTAQASLMPIKLRPLAIMSVTLMPMLMLITLKPLTATLQSPVAVPITLRHFALFY